jgi:CRP/FNR family cyclic AMP-dependent transcriptional regulator
MISQNRRSSANRPAGTGGPAADTARPDVLSARTRACLERICHERKWRDGDVLLRAGDVPSWVIGLLEGRLRVSRIRPNGVEDLRKGTRPGGTLGLVSVVAQRPFPFSVTAAGPCTTRLYDAQQLLVLMHSDGEVALDLARALALRAAELEEATMDDRDESLLERVHAALLRLHALGAGRPVVGGFALRVSQYDLACMVGSSRQYVNLQLRHLQEVGMVRLGYRSIVLLQTTADNRQAPPAFPRK